MAEVKKYRKKPVEIEAIQFTGDAWKIVSFTGGAGTISSYGSDVTIHTLEGDMKVSLGDWVIKGIKGEFYPCKPGIFEETYDAV